MQLINGVDSVCGANVHVVVHKNRKVVPMRMAPTTKMLTAMERKRFVHWKQLKF